MKKSRKAFTLVELLIVIVVIGILAGMMMLASGKATNSAEAAKIIGNMTQIKKAFHLWYLNNHDRVIKEAKSGYNEYKIKQGNTTIFPSEFIKSKGGDKEIMKYISNGSSIKLKDKASANKEGDYAVVALNYSTKWYICYNLGNNTALKKILAAKQSSSQLIGANSINIGGAGGIGDARTNPYIDQKYVCMLMLQLSE